MIERVYTEKAPKPIGPYSQALRAGPFLFVSGQLGIDPLSGKLVEGFEEQAKLAMANVKAILEQAGYSWADVVKVTVYLSDISNFQKFNELYSALFQTGFPARSVVAVKELPKGAKIEMDVVAYRPE